MQVGGAFRFTKAFKKNVSSGGGAYGLVECVNCAFMAVFHVFMFVLCKLAELLDSLRLKKKCVIRRRSIWVGLHSNWYCPSCYTCVLGLYYASFAANLGVSSQFMARFTLNL